mmetsp:Transcript_29051/g.69416  ORF Transcript_29051/g.69416 Transcript_29051/m.69416 type:complete len:93 (-) Transcript_29051:1214-1492(-)
MSRLSVSNLIAKVVSRENLLEFLVSAKLDTNAANDVEQLKTELAGWLGKTHLGPLSNPTLNAFNAAFDEKFGNTAELKDAIKKYRKSNAGAE